MEQAWRTSYSHCSDVQYAIAALFRKSFVVLFSRDGMAQVSHSGNSLTCSWAMETIDTHLRRRFMNCSALAPSHATQLTWRATKPTLEVARKVGMIGKTQVGGNLGDAQVSGLQQALPHLQPLHQHILMNGLPGGTLE